MKQIIRDASGYYLLGYNSTQAPTDGKFHEIKVRVTRRNVDVRARKGYWAYTNEDVARATAPPKPDAPSAVTAALNAIAEPPRGRAARFWIGMAKGTNGSPRRDVRVGADVGRGRSGARSRERRESGHAHRDCSRRPSGVPRTDPGGRGRARGQFGHDDAVFGRERGEHAGGRRRKRFVRRRYPDRCSFAWSSRTAAARSWTPRPRN